MNQEEARKKMVPRILVAAPTSKRHEKVITSWLEHLNKLSYPYFDVLLVDTTEDEDDYFYMLGNQEVKCRPITVIRAPWNRKEHPFAVQMLASARETIRKFFVEREYSHLMWLDDDIFLPTNGLQQLLWYNKEIVGFHVHIFPKKKRRPCVFKSGEIQQGQGADLFTFAELREYKQFVDRWRSGKLKYSERKLIDFVIKDKNRPYLFPCYAVNLGCLLVQRRVMEKTKFRSHPQFIMGEDLWWFAEANDKGYTFWCDSKTRCEHRNTEWGSIMETEPRDNMQLLFASGPVNTGEEK